jgi:hypothetical protein
MAANTISARLQDKCHKLQYINELFDAISTLIKQRVRNSITLFYYRASTRTARVYMAERMLKEDRMSNNTVRIAKQDIEACR